MVLAVKITKKYEQKFLPVHEALTLPGRDWFSEHDKYWIRQFAHVASIVHVCRQGQPPGYRR
jgi:hypothetical protein